MNAEHVVQSVRSSIKHGGTSLNAMPSLLRYLLEHELWRSRYVPILEETVEFENFCEFVHEDDPRGLGTDIQTLRKFCQAVNDEDARWVENRLDELEAEARPWGTNQHTSGDEEDYNVNLHRSEKPAGNSRQYALRRLRNAGQEHEDSEFRQKCQRLHEQVLEGEKTPNAAMIEAGFRKKRVSFERNVDKAAKAILNHFSEEEIAELVKRLIGVAHS